MGFLKSDPAPLAPIPAAAPPPVVPVPVTAVQDKVREDKKRRKGKPATMLTGGVGLTTEPEISSPSLLGKKVT